jgi:5-oxoprolinase (ATP-hydrolysing) subunit A
MGEGMPNEAEMMPYLDACSIACGYHAGDENIIKNTVLLAKNYGVSIGAHPSFPDRENFGRTPMQLPKEELVKMIVDQVRLLIKVCCENDVEPDHIKPHGALYNMAIKDVETASAVVEAFSQLPKGLALYAPEKSAMALLAQENNILVCREAFADRNYNEDGSLVNRNLPNAVLTDPEVVWKHVLGLVKHQQITSISGKYMALQADVLCVHGDNPNAVAILQNLRRNLTLL